MNFVEAIRSGFTNYVTFTGRTQRSGYWYWVLFIVLGNLVFSAVDTALFQATPDQPVSLLGGVFALATFLPSLAVGVRRLHDIDRTGWWLLLYLIPVIGFLVLLYFLVQRGTRGANRFGPDPRGGGGGDGPVMSRSSIPRAGG